MLVGKEAPFTLTDPPIPNNIADYHHPEQIGLLNDANMLSPGRQQHLISVGLTRVADVVDRPGQTYLCTLIQQFLQLRCAPSADAPRVFGQSAALEVDSAHVLALTPRLI